MREERRHAAQRCAAPDRPKRSVGRRVSLVVGRPLLSSIRDMRKNIQLQRLANRTGVPIEQRTVSVGAVKTSYLVTGAGQPVFLIHGLGASGSFWYPVFGPLAARFRVIAPDVVGFGDSDKPPAPYDGPYFSTWLAGLMNALGVHRAHLIGHSMGGAIALHFTLDEPERVARLVLVDSLGLGMGSPWIGILMVLMMLLPSHPISLWIAQHLVMYDPSKLDWEEFRELGGSAEFDKRIFWQMFRQPKQWTISAGQLRRIRPPTMLLWGEGDRNFPLARARAAQRLIPNAQVHVISRARHIPFLDKPKAFNDALIQFLGEEVPTQPLAT
jgi:2-hydroxymuconate-semialdehyde hydrolase